jgi:hypothetical protein
VVLQVLMVLVVFLVFQEQVVLMVLLVFRVDLGQTDLQEQVVSLDQMVHQVFQVSLGHQVVTVHRV